MAIQYAGHDKSLAKAVVLRLISGATIEFQFPPRMQSDNRRGEWSEGELPGMEPVAAFATSSAREMTLTWTYIVDGSTWSSSRIAKNVKAIRGYFALVRGKTPPGNALVTKFKMWLIGGTKEISCRIKSVNVKHSDTIVGEAAIAYPLRTDVTIDIRIWTSADEDGKLVNLGALNDNIDADWY